MRYVFVLLLAGVMMAGTWFVGWMMVPIAAAAYAGLRREVHAPREAGVAALIAWVVLLLSFSRLPAFSTLLTQLGAIFPAPGIAVAVLALVLAVVLAASAARLTLGIVGIRPRAQSLAPQGSWPDRR